MLPKLQAKHPRLLLLLLLGEEGVLLPNDSVLLLLIVVGRFRKRTRRSSSSSTCFIIRGRIRVVCHNSIVIGLVVEHARYPISTVDWQLCQNMSPKSRFEFRQAIRSRGGGGAVWEFHSNKQTTTTFMTPDNDVVVVVVVVVPRRPKNDGGAGVFGRAARVVVRPRVSSNRQRKRGQTHSLLSVKDPP